MSYSRNTVEDRLIAMIDRKYRKFDDLNESELPDDEGIVDEPEVIAGEE